MGRIATTSIMLLVLMTGAVAADEFEGVSDELAVGTAVFVGVFNGLTWLGNGTAIARDTRSWSSAVWGLGIGVLTVSGASKLSSDEWHLDEFMVVAGIASVALACAQLLIVSEPEKAQAWRLAPTVEKRSGSAVRTGFAVSKRF